MRKFWILAFLIAILLTLGLAPLPVLKQAETPSQVIAAVNAFRTANGLPALEVDYALMGAAQAHSDYQAAIKQVTHTGEGGTRPIDRAYAWGFGSGSKAFVSENIAGGYKVNIETAIYDFWQDYWHLHTMLNPNAHHIGAGVAASGSSNYYTVVTGYYSGSRPKATAPPNESNPDESTPAETSLPQPTAVAYDPFIISTPREDGVVIHVVGYGQTLIGIANTYGVELADLYQYNHYNKDTVIYPKEWVIIRPAGHVSIPVTPTNTSSTSDDAVKMNAQTDLELDAQPGALNPSTPTRTAPPPRPTSTPKDMQPSGDYRVVTSTATNRPLTITEGQEPLVLGIVIASSLLLIGVLLYGFINRK